MKLSTHVPPLAASATIDGAKARIGSAATALAAHARVWVEACADYSAAAAIYEHLSKLSDAELHRRGLSRATLGSDICRACDRTNA
jgi:hypothetical protein